MKKLFSIVMVIAMAVSCLAISPAAFTTTGDVSFTHEIAGDVVTFSFVAEATTDIPEGMDPIFDIYFEDEAGALEFMGEETLVKNVGIDDTTVIAWDYDIGYFSLGAKPVNWVVDRADGRINLDIEFSFKIIGAEPGDTITLTCCDIMIGAFGADLRPIELDGEYTFVYEDTDAPETDAPETDAPETEPEAPVLPEAPAAAAFQTLAGCEVCGVEAGVRFKAIVSGDTKDFGMKITGNNVTFDLNSKSEGFKSVETDNGIEFTAVIFTTVVDFTVVVYETYAEGTVESAGTTNA